MGINEFITKDEFQVYNQVRDKKKELAKKKNSAIFDYVIAGLFGVSALINGYVSMKYDVPPTLQVLTASSGIVSIASAIKGFKESNKANKLENELNELMERPEYQSIMQLHGRV